MIDDTFSIRMAGLNDYDRAREVMIETLNHHVRAAPDFFCHTGDAPPSRAFVAELIDTGKGALLIAEHEGIVIGFATVRINVRDAPYVVPETRGIVDSLGVATQWQRHGVGRRLMAAAQDWARERGAQRMMLTVWEANEEAIAFYKELGYTTVYRTMSRPL